MTRKDTAPGEAVGDGLTHLAFFYDDERDYVSYLSAFATAGRRNGEPVFLAVPGRHAALLRESLGASSNYLSYGAMTQTGRNPARLIPELTAFIDAHPGTRVRYVGEAFWPGRSAAELCEATRHEALMNLAFAAAPVTILCPYDVAGLAPHVVGGAECTHPAVVQGGRTEVPACYAGRGVIPPGYDRPLPAPPAGAEVLFYQESLRPVRHLVTEHAAALGMADDRVANLVIAAAEVTANTLAHTTGGGMFHIWHTEDEVICQIRDRGWIADPLAGRRRHRPEDSGHGLWVVNQVCDLVEIRSTRAGTTIRLHMRRATP
jgi:anti-sigma regulatory factor (Ser/Thr protein kinase)